ncbi:S-adenosylmethionine/tRNA-ribosyltransferase-isomerase [Gloeomargarita lithophora Alchichica-D10]|uniref:S-adenosylmethionine:tRNA ribosyltransferase-isomerase n=1 Tax=Gloeomargarita lithophora Alchichica-D10 TaxID=1188229 RepID=A0A1J0AE02_9CYAN|nr:tRNA preQ1(34) S-adenosylmethionine ribosyltransferase-isomerase QueA [Gloeomargarita lithophora]APB34131.1 S-adenosylmethionine/tRNA-ribosyltransferase-isomerase [Gloeomargarita lithophora Alchichica-D10]
MPYPAYPPGAGDWELSNYNYHLPQELIAQTAMVPRDHARLLVVDPDCHQHHRFDELPALLRPGDLLVLNNTKVLPARLIGTRPGGGITEFLLLEPGEDGGWRALVRPGRRVGAGTVVRFPAGEETQLLGVVQVRDETTGGRWVQFQTPDGMAIDQIRLLQILDKIGELPLPPYIQKFQGDPGQYQTVYAQALGAVAAPTAGLHFTDDLLKKLQNKGIAQAMVTLHVGLGTFRPVNTPDVRQHELHSEWIEVSPATVAQIHQTQQRGGRVIGVGTTVARALEAAAQGGELQATTGKINLYIYPGYTWRVIDGLITNFHLPQSSLLLLVSALIGRERLLYLYEQAIQERYRFYSLGDAMLILPDGDFR